MKLSGLDFKHWEAKYHLPFHIFIKLNVFRKHNLSWPLEKLSAYACEDFLDLISHNFFVFLSVCRI